jgi:hypothetical protein
MAMPQSARSAGKICRSATNSTFMEGVKKQPLTANNNLKRPDPDFNASIFPLKNGAVHGRWMGSPLG